MLEKVIIGVILGAIAGFFSLLASRDEGAGLIIAIVSILACAGFILKSFGYGLEYGLMAIAEVSFGVFGVYSIVKAISK